MSNIQAATLDYAAPDDIGPRTLNKVTWRLIPFMFLLYICGYLDRVNLSFGGSAMQRDLHLDEGIYGLGAGIFFIGYFLFEVPSNLILERVGARRWIARIMVTWGFVASSLMFVRGAWSFYFLRFSLGVAEAGFFPGMVLYLTYWFPARQRARAVAAFMTSIAIAGVIGGPISGALLKLNGVHGLAGWQWLFLMEGLPSIPMGILVYFYLTDKPEQAKWLAPAEREWLIEHLRAEKHVTAHHDPHTMTAALKDPRVWKLSLLYFMLMIGLYSFSFWAPKILKSISGLSETRVAVLCAIPYSVAAISMVFIGQHSDRTGERRGHVGLSALTAAVGLAMLPLCHGTVQALLGLSVAGIGIWGALGPFWVLPTDFLRGTAAAAGIAVINSLGCLGGFVGPSMFGYVLKYTGGNAGGLLTVAAAMLAGMGIVLSLPKPNAQEGRSHI